MHAQAVAGIKEEDENPAAPPDEHQIEDLIADNLKDNLSILPETDLGNALHDYVDKVQLSSP